MENRQKHSEMALVGKVAVITGGGSGIGRSVALALAHQGSKVVICGRRSAKLEETIQESRNSAGAVIAVSADVSQQEDVKRLVEQTLDNFGRIDFLINNAGIARGGPLHRIRIDDWDWVLNVNLRGSMLTAREVLPIMRSQRCGHIILISSESGIEYYKDDIAYGVSKHALNDLGEFIQRENQDYNIRVNTICPGMVVTEMTENEPGLDHDRCLFPEDIADLVLWLLTRRQNIKIGTPILIQTMLNPWE